MSDQIINSFSNNHATVVDEQNNQDEFSSISFCERPFTGIGCNQTWGKYLGHYQLIFHAVYLLFSLILAIIIIIQTKRLLHYKGIKPFTLQHSIYLLLHIAILTILLRSIDPLGLFESLSRSFQQLVNDICSAALYSVAFCVLMHWITLKKTLDGPDAEHTSKINLRKYLVLFAFFAIISTFSLCKVFIGPPYLFSALKMIVFTLFHITMLILGWRVAIQMWIAFHQNAKLTTPAPSQQTHHNNVLHRLNEIKQNIFQFSQPNNIQYFYSFDPEENSLLKYVRNELHLNHSASGENSNEQTVSSDQNSSHTKNQNSLSNQLGKQYADSAQAKVDSNDHSQITPNNISPMASSPNSVLEFIRSQTPKRNFKRTLSTGTLSATGLVHFETKSIESHPGLGGLSMIQFGNGPSNLLRHHPSLSDAQYFIDDSRRSSQTVSQYSSIHAPLQIFDYHHFDERSENQTNSPTDNQQKFTKKTHSKLNERFSTPPYAALQHAKQTQLWYVMRLMILFSIVSLISISIQVWHLLTHFQSLLHKKPSTTVPPERNFKFILTVGEYEILQFLTTFLILFVFRNFSSTSHNQNFNNSNINMVKVNPSCPYPVNQIEPQFQAPNLIRNDAFRQRLQSDSPIFSSNNYKGV